MPSIPIIEPSSLKTCIPKTACKGGCPFGRPTTRRSISRLVGNDRLFGCHAKERIRIVNFEHFSFMLRRLVIPINNCRWVCFQIHRIIRFYLVSPIKPYSELARSRSTSSKQPYTTFGPSDCRYCRCTWATSSSYSNSWLQLPSSDCRSSLVITIEPVCFLLVLLIYPFFKLDFCVQLFVIRTCDLKLRKIPAKRTGNWKGRQAFRVARQSTV
jgi:hypothetical protein